ncbi:MAG: hypothetical protein A3H28_17545 [Acidobacteria bacterium RIFCSPLOWO2_02_FULL_61_28]|nr:MAG: hypothetical protein A3H28_17545 [Acidobacteria bacterium RIFCSPLOWO2_02_FULL_61_28]
MLPDLIVPLPERFSEHLENYCEQARAAIGSGKHHDHRRALFMDFLRKAFGIEVTEVELEHKVKAASAKGLIDAFYHFVIFEFKTNLETERAKALEELEKYFEAQKAPGAYVAAVTDGLVFELYDYDAKTQRPELVRKFRLEPEAPLVAFQELDELLTIGHKIPPLSEQIVLRLGPLSMTFRRSKQALRKAFDLVKEIPSVEVKFREWNTLLSKVYGSSPNDEDLFIKHTYLTMVSRAIVAARVFPTTTRDTQLHRGLIDGEFFRNKGIQNLAEPDFFSWAWGTKAEPTFFEFFGNLFRRLDEFDWTRVDEDLLKMLYQELVDPEDRQLLGEFYTPDWLAELTLENIGYSGGTLLDPACGSGTFLFCAIRRLRTHGFKRTKLVREALDSITGIDVHPVATLMAKANILLALSGELPGYDKEVSLRVYLADTLLTGEDAKRRALHVKVGEQEEFLIPLDSLENGRDLDSLVDKMAGLASRGILSTEAEVRTEKGFMRLLEGYTSHEIFLWRQNFLLMLRLLRQDRDTVWAFILKNAYRPAYLRRQKVDVIVANPPWLSLRDIRDAAYKAKIKELAFRYKLLEKKERKLFTQLDTSTVFFEHAEREFLREGGTMAFVMPRSVILAAKQHLAFQRGGFTAIQDFAEVKGLFKVPTCVLIRDGKVTRDNIPITRWIGDLARGDRNLPWSKAKAFLKSETEKWSFLVETAAQSAYFPRILQGATLVPRCLWFAESPPGYPIKTKAPFLRTAKAAYRTAKKPWDLEVEGKVERKFLFATALAEDLLPFAVRRLRLVVLPLAKRGTGKHRRFVMLNHLDILAEGASFASDWVKEAEKIWESRKKKEQPNVYDYLNYDQKIANQNPRAKFVVLYNKSGTNIAAAYLTPSEFKRIGKISVQGFVADHVAYRYYADSEAHALYLVGVLNSHIVNEAIKPYQPKGLQGERDIHRRPFEVCPIPLFDPKNRLHQQIARVAAKARKEVLRWKDKIEGKAGQAREAARKLVQPELSELNELVVKLLDGHRFLLTSSTQKPRRSGNLFMQGETD